ncbi:type 2 DNA topoisomerase 6 subunit B-like [Selaginella moellendorffii]|uniref:type 2 DNA topoisomerase 6 subunit B-like n=1 Tax=Selaginella moellendorffii TaxID=88036 RepID=UPI000D1C2CE6|nr:type 2 DNA topoisomerase 6 subunit B-like [Selaginella moellendorffii]|eukprot:XP_024532368.1 type 2 DNA topoisomerase 6 subunit B-like [Selaginella moellendorffii]
MAVFEAPAPMQAVIGSAISRCRSASNPGALISVTLSCIDACDGVDRSKFSFSVSDTGLSVTGKAMDDFCHLVVANPPILDHAEILWDRVLEVSTPDPIEKKMRNYQLRFTDASGLQILELRPQWREKRTLVSMDIEGPTLETVSSFRNLLEKFSLPIIEVSLEWHYVNCRGERDTYQSREVLTREPSELDELATGFAHYLHNSRLSEADRVAGIHVNIGRGGSDNIGSSLHACVAITEPLTTVSSKTKIMYFEDFAYTPVPSAMQQFLSKVDWMKFNLPVQSVDTETATITWECSRHESIDLVLHKVTKNILLKDILILVYPKQVKRAIEGALHDLKLKLPHRLASPQAIKMMSCVPDLSRCIAGLIKSSTDASFQAQCASLLGLLPSETHKLEGQISDKLSSIVIDTDNSNSGKLIAYDNLAKEAGSDTDNSNTGKLITYENLAIEASSDTDKSDAEDFFTIP